MEMADGNEAWASDNTYFFQQNTYRRSTKRFKKHPDDLPQDLRFAHLNPRVAAYLANKEKEKVEDIEEIVHKKSLLPQITETVNLIRQQLNSALSNDEASQRFLIEQAKTGAAALLPMLGKVLNIYHALRIDQSRRLPQLYIPRTLEHTLHSSHRELTADVHFVPREWQLPSNREEHLRKMMSREEQQRSEAESVRDGLTPMGSTSNISAMGSRSGDQDDTRSVKSGKSTKSQKESEASPGVSSATGPNLKVPKAGVGAGARPSKVATGRNSQLSDILEHDEARTTTSKTDQMPQILQTKRESRDKISVGSARPKTRLEKFRSNSGIDQRADGRTSTLSMRRSNLRPDDVSTVPDTVSESGKSLIDRSGFYTVVSFQLSSKTCEEKGWIIHPAASEDRERETLLEWATQRLQMSIKERKEQEEKDKEEGLDRPIYVYYYGDSRKETLAKYSSRRGGSRSAPAISKNQRPYIPLMPDTEDRIQLFTTTLSDGSTTVFYPSGQTAILSSCSGPKKQGFYTIVYDDSPLPMMLACFTPTGRGCCFHSNGNVMFLSNESGGTLSDEQGAIIKRWSWPPHNSKLGASIIFQLNPYLTFRCASRSQMNMYFTCQKETTKVSVGMAPGAEEPKTKEDLGQLMSGIMFSSQAAKEFGKLPKAKVQITKDKKSKAAKGKDKQKNFNQNPEIQKLLDFPEPTENDHEADKQLFRLQRKIKNLVDDWLEHYRICVGISSPHLRSMRDTQPHPRRDTHSAKSSPGGVRVVIESLSTQVATPSISTRVPSAPPGVAQHHPGSSYGGSTPHDTLSIAGKEGVKFDDNPVEMDFDDVTSFIRTTSLPSSAGSVSSYSVRSKSAPQRLSVLAPVDGISGTSVGACTVALRQVILGEDKVICRCSRHKIPFITDVEYDQFINRYVPEKQIIIISIVSSLYPNTQESMEMLEQMYSDKNRNRTRPCLQCRTDSYRVLLYDVASAAEFTDHTQPLLLRRHNVVPGMFLMYEGGRLLFCDHIFNGYGNARKDFHKQLMMTRRAAMLGQSLPQDFHFSPQHGRHGPRSAWGGEIGGAGVDLHGSAGVSMDQSYLKETTLCPSLSSSENSINATSYRLSGLESAAKYISIAGQSGDSIHRTLRGPFSQISSMINSTLPDSTQMATTAPSTGPAYMGLATPTVA